MKKRIYLTFATAVLTLMMGMSAFAAKDYVIDDAGLITEEQEEKLQNKLEDINDKYDSDVVIVTVDSLGGKSSEAFADDYYDYNGYGSDGILLLISMEDRDWAISTKGFGIKAFTDAGQGFLVKQFKPSLSNGDYYKAFDTYADWCDDYLQHAKDGKPYDVGNMPKLPLSKIWIAIAGAIGSLFGGGMVGSMKSQLKSVHRQSGASHYSTGSIDLNTQVDHFMYRKVDRTERAQSSGSGGGSSTHRSSSGSMHGGSHGKF